MYCMYSIAHIFTNTSFKLWRNWVSPRPKIFITWPNLREYEAKIWGKQRRLLSHATLTSSHCCTQTTKLGQLAKMSFTLPPLFNVFPFCQLERERDLGGKNSLKTPYILQYGNLKTKFRHFFELSYNGLTTFSSKANFLDKVFLNFQTPIIMMETTETNGE